MTLSTISAFVARSVGATLEPFSYEPPKLGDHDVRVAVTHCGVCHTDIHAIDDYYSITHFPFVPGHEIVGHVTAAGPAVNEVKLGDRVGIGWQGRSCGHCEWCLKGETQLCMEIGDTTVMVPYGGFATSVSADSRFVYLLPESMSSECAAVLMCAGLSVYAALQAHLTNPQLKVAVHGVGGLGHLAIQFAHAIGCEVTAISSSPAKREQALGFGADHFIDINDIPSLRKVYYGFDLVLSTTSQGTCLEILLNTLKKRGKLVMVGFPDLQMNSTDLVAHELTFSGSLLGNAATIAGCWRLPRSTGSRPWLS